MRTIPVASSRYPRRGVQTDAYARTPRHARTLLFLDAKKYDGNERQGHGGFGLRAASCELRAVCEIQCLHENERENLNHLFV